MTLRKRIEALRREIEEVSPVRAHDLAGEGAVLIDVREADECAFGTAQGAHTLGRGYLEMRVGAVVPGNKTTVLLLCDSGSRSLLAAADLRALGYRDVRSVAGGFTGWKNAGLPTVRADNARVQARYARQVVLPEIGPGGQQRLAAARVLVVGAGGLGCPAALYLAAGGVGTLGLVDNDVVERSNLHRQVLHRDAAVGAAKVASASATLAALNPDITLRTHELRLTRANAEKLLSEYDLVLDGSDNFPTRYLVNDACLRLGLTNVYGAVQGFAGQISVFAPGKGPCYRCLFPAPPAAEDAPSCNEAGVLGPMAGLVGVLQALEAMKIIVGFGEPYIGRLLRICGRSGRNRELALPRDPDCVSCGARAVTARFVLE